MTEKLGEPGASSGKAEASERERAAHQPPEHTGADSTKPGEPVWSTLRWTGVVTAAMAMPARPRAA